MNDQENDIKPEGEKAEEEVVMDLDHESIDEQIINKLGGKKKPATDEDVDDIVSEEDDNSPATIKKLRADLKTAQQEKMDIMTSWQRDKADFLNARKRDQETQADVIRFANQNLVIDMLPTLDGYEQAKAQPSWTSVDETWRKGVEALMDKIYTSLLKIGVEKYGKVGDVFDTNLHEAIGNEATTEKEKDHTIALVMQTGYKLHDKVIRPALVKVFQA
ncbi:MAG: nucleotide exchange factor GrpE [Patescibacteria group bacterium]